MFFQVSTSGAIDFAPSSLAAELAQNVRTIITTPRGTVPLDRDFGIDFRFIDNPEPIAQMQLRVEIINALKAYEPRAIVRNISFKQDAAAAQNGKLAPVITLEIADE